MANPVSVVVQGSASGFAQEIVAGAHRSRSDEPQAAGGTDDAGQRAKLLEIADKCPVHRSLAGEINIHTKLVS